MKLKTISKFVLGTIFGCLLTAGIYATADINNPANNIKQVSSTIPVEDVNTFAKVYAITKNYYIESVADSKLMSGAISGMLTNLDPHSAFLNEDDFKQLSEMTTGSFAGLGIEVNRDKGEGIKVIAPIDGTPAFKAGIKSGDLIIKIDGEPVSGMTLDEAIKKMRGKIGSKVTITILRSSELKPLIFTIKRDKINVKSVSYTWLAPNYAYIRISQFQADSSNELVLALNKIYKKKPQLKGLVLDLRDDPGGILQSAVGVSSVFLPQNKLVVYTDGRLYNSRQKFYAQIKDYDIDGTQAVNINAVPTIFKTLPMVVLVNQGTASASEIVSGALQDYKRARILGTKTFGKGSVQTIIPISENTAVKLTTALYFTPNGRSIQAEGIRPDIIIQSQYDDLYNSWDMSESSYNNHLSNPNVKLKTKLNSKPYDIYNSSAPIIKPPKQISSKSELEARVKNKLNNIPKVVDQSQAQVDLKDDFQLQWALNIIEGKPLPKTVIKIK